MPVLDCIADYDGAARVQRVLVGARLDSDDGADFNVTTLAAENTGLAEVLSEAFDPDVCYSDISFVYHHCQY